MKKNKIRRLKTDNIRDKQSFKQAFSQLMDFPGWDEGRLNEWIDLIRQLDGPNTPLARFRSSEEAMFFIEVPDAESIMHRDPDILAELMRTTSHINRQYIHHTGKPILSVTFVP